MTHGNVLLIWDRMGDYHRARWAALQKAIPDKKVFAADLGASDHLYGWENTDQNPLYFQLSTKNPAKFDSGRIVKFVKILTEKNIQTVCIPGYGKPEYIFFLIFSRLTRRNVILFAESWYPGNYFFDSLKALFLKLTCHAYMVSGARAFEHFSKRLRIKTSAIRIGYSVVDNDHFSRISNDRPSCKEKILLCIARFVPEKNLELLVNSFVTSTLPSNNWQLVVIGGGPLQGSLQQLSDGHKIQLLPWQKYEALPEIYHNADVFILPSKFEPWGLVVNEAMAASKPVILSDKVGCLPDLLQPAVNGWSFDSDSSKDLIEIFNAIPVLDQRELEEKGVKSKEIIDKYSLSLFANNLKALILKVN